MKGDPDKRKDSLTYGKIQKTWFPIQINAPATETPVGVRDPSRCPAEIEKLTLKFMWKREGLRRT